MKKRTLLRNACVALFFIVVFFGCYKWKSYSQPTQALPSQVFYTTLSIQPGDDPDNDYTAKDNEDFGLFGVLLPNGWTVDEDEFEFTYNSDSTESTTGWVYSNEVQTARLEELDPAPLGYHWWGGQTDDIVNLWGFRTIDFTVPILPTDEEDSYNLKYTVGDLGDDTHPGKREPAYIKTPLMPIEITSNANLDKTVMASASVYPTITTDFINIYVVKTSVASKARIVAMSGKTVISKVLDKTHNTIDVNSLAAGNYFVVIKIGDKTKSQKIMVK